KKCVGGRIPPRYGKSLYFSPHRDGSTPDISRVPDESATIRGLRGTVLAGHAETFTTQGEGAPDRPTRAGCPAGARATRRRTELLGRPRPATPRWETTAPRSGRPRRRSLSLPHRAAPGCTRVRHAPARRRCPATPRRPPSRAAPPP